MFYSEYLDEYYLEELFNNYDINYLKSIDKNKFEEIYNLLKKYNFDFIEDIIEEYLEIFQMDKDIVEKRILSLKKVLGENWLDKIGNDMSYLEYIVHEKNR